MTAPVYESTTVTDFNSGSTTHNANMPATVNAGDLLLAIVAFDGSNTPSITTPGSWTLLLINPSSKDPRAAIYGKVADGTEDGTTVNWVTSVSCRGSIHVVRVSAWNGSLDGVLIAAGTAGSTGSHIGLAVGPSADMLWVAAQAKSSVNSFAGSAPTGYSNQAQTNASEDSGSSASIASATKTSTSANEFISALWIDLTGSTSFLIGVTPTTTPPASGGGAPVIGSPIVRAA